jgi:carboxyl-terminal processing protease
MTAKGVFAILVLAGVLVSGGWLMERGLSTTTPAAAAPIDGRHLYEEVLARVAARYVDSIPPDSLYQRTVDGVIRELHDPHSLFLPPDRLAKLDETTSGRYAGIGVQVDIRDDWITVIEPIPGGPASEAGIQTGDRIVEIDGKPTYRWTPDEGQKALRGDAGSSVRVAIARPGVGAKIPYVLVRREIQTHAVQHAQLLREGIGYLDLAAFSDQAATELRRSIDSLSGAGMTTLILDLRGDPGGLLSQGVAVADLFLNPGDTIVSLRGQGPDVNRAFNDTNAQRWPALKIAVLVDSNSASASEIVAGALQDHDRATVVGTRTYGKGSAQNVFNLEGGGGVKLTVARWYTPLGRSIDRAGDTTTGSAAGSRGKASTYKTPSGRVLKGGWGINPDVVVIDSARVKEDAALQRAVGAHGSDFRDALTAFALHVKATVSAVDRLVGRYLARYVFGPEAEFRRLLDQDSVVSRAVSAVSAVSGR